MQTALFSFHVRSQSGQLLIITTLFGMLSIQNLMKFQLFIHLSVKILIFIYLMNTAYIYSHIQFAESRRPVERPLTEAFYWNRFLSGAQHCLIHGEGTIFRRRALQLSGERTHRIADCRAKVHIDPAD